MKKLMVRIVTVTLIWSYVIPIEAMLRPIDPKMHAKLAARKKQISQRPKDAGVSLAIPEDLWSQLPLQYEPKTTGSISQQVQSVAEVESQPGWLRQGWQAAQQKMSQFRTGLTKGVQRKAVSAQRVMTGVYAEVQSWNWTKIIRILIAIAAVYGIVIKLYNNQGELLNTISAAGETMGQYTIGEGIAAISGAASLGVMALNYSDVMRRIANLLQPESNSLINLTLAITQDPGQAIQALEHRYNKEIKGTISDNMLNRKIYSEAIEYFKKGLSLQKNIILEWVKSQRNTIQEQIELLEKIKKDFAQENKDFPLDVKSCVVAIAEIIQFLDLESLQ